MGSGTSTLQNRISKGLKSPLNRSKSRLAATLGSEYSGSMTNGRRPPGYMTEDLEMREVSGPPKYTSRTDRPVEHVTLRTTAGEVMGYIYVNDDDDAAGWQSQAGSSPAAQNHASFWLRILHDAKKLGLKPSAALDEMLRATDPSSHVVAGSRTTSINLAALKALATQQPG